MPPPPSALCPRPAPRHRLLKGRRGVRMPRPGPLLQEALPAPARGPPASPHTDSRRVGLTRSRARVLPPPARPEWAPLPAPRSFRSRGACGRESADRERGLRSALPQPPARPVHDCRRRGSGSAPCLGGNRSLRGERVRLGHTCHELWWGSPMRCLLPAPPGTSSPCRFLRKAAPKQRSPAHPDSVCSPPPRLSRVRPPLITVGTQPAGRLDAGVQGGNKHR